MARLQQDSTTFNEAAADDPTSFIMNQLNSTGFIKSCRLFWDKKAGGCHRKAHSK
jgi:hypothetical protein